MKNNKGFTLVELLVAVAILGLITVIAIPQISNLQSENKSTKYETYEKALLSGGKLYVDSYSADMFGNNASGCYDIPYADLKGKNLVKDFNINNVKCDGGSDNKTFVRVYKANDNYLYKTSVYCVDKNNKVVYEDKTAGTYGLCDGTQTDETAPEIRIEVEKIGWTTGKDETAKIIISDDYGLIENTKIKYAWVEETTSIPESAYKTHNFKNNRSKTIVSLEIPVPQNKTGIYYLVINPLDVRDANGNYQAEKTSREFKFDNTAPTLPTIGAIGTVSGSNKTGTIKTAASGSIDDHSGIKEYRYMVTSTSTAPSNTNSKFKATLNFERSCGSSYYAWVIAVDNVGNKSSVKSLGNTSDGADSYSSYSSCSSTCGTGTKTRTNTCALVTTGLSTSCTSTTSCCDEVTYEDGTTCSKLCGGGTYNQLAYSKKDPSIRCSSKDLSSGGASCNSQGCCESTETSSCGSYGGCSATCGGGTKSRTCYKKSKYDGSSCGSYTDTASCNTGSCAPTITCSWTGNTGRFITNNSLSGHWGYYNVVGYTSGSWSSGKATNGYETGYGRIDYTSTTEWRLVRTTCVDLQGKTYSGGHLSNLCSLDC